MKRFPIAGPAMALCLLAIAAPAHAGLWVERSVPSVSIWHTRLTACGDRCAAYATDIGDSLWIFDADLGRWVAWGTEQPHTVRELLARGRTVLMVTDSLAVAYAAGTPEVRAVALDADLLGNYAFACGPRCAAVVTTTTVFVFDALRGAWFSHPLPGTSGQTVPGSVVCGDEYAAVALNRGYDAPAVNVFYSLPLGAFTETLQGISAGYLNPNGRPLDGGCAGLVVDNDGYQTIFMGWSARTGRITFQSLDFDPLNGTPSTSWPTSSSWISGPWTTVEVVVDRTLDRYSGRSTHYGYDTWTGRLSTYARTYDSTTETGSGAGGGGGRYTVSKYGYKAEDGSWKAGLVVFDGATGTHHVLPTDMPQYDPSLVTLRGEHGILFALPGQWIKVFTVEDGAVGSASTAIAGDVVKCLKAGPGYLAASEGGSGGTTMTAHVYRLNSGTWRTFTHPFITGSLSQASPDLLLYDTTEYAGHEVVFYSPKLDMVRRVNIASYSGYRVSGPLGLSFEPDAAWLFDAWRGTLVHQPGQHAVGDDGVLHYVCADPDGRLLAYSAMTGAWHALEGLTDPYVMPGSAAIGLGRTHGDRPVVAAFNALDGSWATVTCRGDWLGYLAGRRVALVVCEEYVYGYTMELTEVAVEPPVTPPSTRQVGAPGPLAVTAVEPNPCNPRAVIRFRLPRPGAATLDLYDARGRHVARLLDASLPAGEHQAAWDGRDDAGRPLAGGTYVVLLRQGTARASGKVTLVR